VFVKAADRRCRPGAFLEAHAAHDGTAKSSPSSWAGLAAS
jgi:hypothetical protein